MGLKKAYRGTIRELEHPSISGSPFLPVRPEYSSGEVLLGSLYRSLITGTSESSVDLTEIDTLPERLSHGNKSKLGFWNAVLLEKGGIASPSTRNSNTRQLSPFVPSIANFGCVLGGRPRNRWNPSSLLLSAIGSGTNPDEFENFLGELKTALDVEVSNPSEGQDLFAQFVERNLRELAENGFSPTSISDLANSTPLAWQNSRPAITYLTPAERFVNDLRSLFGLKTKMTRRHWISLVESTVRFGAVTHFLWTCMTLSRIWELAAGAFSGSTDDFESELESVWQAHAGEQFYLLELMATDARLKTWIGRWYQARIGLSVILHAMSDQGLDITDKFGVYEGADTIGAVSRFLELVRENRSTLHTHIVASTGGENIRSAVGILWEQSARQIACLSGPPKNAHEFARYSLRQLEAGDESQATYDQGYFLKKVGRKQEERIGVRGLGLYSVRPGPLALIALAKSVVSASSGSANLEDFKRHLREYGVHILPDELEVGPLSQDLRKLGLVVDSPDAKGGLSLVDPLPSQEANNE